MVKEWQEKLVEFWWGVNPSYVVISWRPSGEIKPPLVFILKQKLPFKLMDHTPLSYLNIWSIQRNNPENASFIMRPDMNVGPDMNVCDKSASGGTVWYSALQYLFLLRHNDTFHSSSHPSQSRVGNLHRDPWGGSGLEREVLATALP